MIKIRLSRVGKNNNPFYRIVAIEETKKREGKANNVIGFWNPKENKIEINKEKLDKWLKMGAVLNQSVKKLLEI
ncbi:MAG: 30S ribosomal protein S16 [Patescibacteria group bacterium]|nr:MAG: 30S ribosomal protein S16 [Patescibacteria group bacterium]